MTPKREKSQLYDFGADLSIIAFRDNPQFHFLTPALTWFQFLLPQFGYGLAEALIDFANLQDFKKPPPSYRANWPMNFYTGASATELIM